MADNPRQRAEGWFTLVPTIYRARQAHAVGFTLFWWRWSLSLLLVDRDKFRAAAMLKERQSHEG